MGDAAPVTDRALAVLCNLVAACPEGRRAVSRAPDAVPSLVDVLNWADEPGCQEKAAYVLMVLAHRSYGDRAAMAEAAASSAPQERRCRGEESVDGGSRPLARPCGRGTCLRAYLTKRMVNSCF